MTTMEEIKKNYPSLFHSLTNRQNIVSVKAGTIVALAERKKYASMTTQELLTEVNHMLEELRLIESAILEAGRFAAKLNDLVRPFLNSSDSTQT